LQRDQQGQRDRVARREHPSELLVQTRHARPLYTRAYGIDSRLRPAS
jgi:hypothetical protein